MKIVRFEHQRRDDGDARRHRVVQRHRLAGQTERLKIVAQNEPECGIVRPNRQRGPSFKMQLLDGLLQLGNLLLQSGRRERLSRDGNAGETLVQCPGCVGKNDGEIHRLPCARPL